MIFFQTVHSYLLYFLVKMIFQVLIFFQNRRNCIKFLFENEILVKRHTAFTLDSEGRCTVLVMYIDVPVQFNLKSQTIGPPFEVSPLSKPFPSANYDGSDCGVFAVAFATYLVYGTNPQDLMFHIPQMRPHLLECLKVGEMRLFPHF